MEFDRPHIILAASLDGIGKDPFAGYLAHAYCYEGVCTFTYNGNTLRMEKGDCAIIRRGDLVSSTMHSEDCRIDVIYVTPEFIEISTPPHSNYGMKGSLALFNNPIMHLTPEQQQVCALDFDFIKRRLSLTAHNFLRDAMINAIQCMIIDFFDFHTTLYGNDKLSSHYTNLMNRFMGLLDNGDYRQHRDISYYADKLFVTSKHLSEVSKRVSGFPATYWINRYTILDISRHLRNRRETLAQLSELYGFSSPSYFSQYVQKYLGVNPIDL